MAKVVRMRILLLSGDAERHASRITHQIRWLRDALPLFFPMPKV